MPPPAPDDEVLADQLETGWYRYAGRNLLTRVDDDEARAQVAAGQGYDLVHIERDLPIDTPLW